MQPDRTPGPIKPEGGEIYAARIMDMPQAMARLKRVAEELGLPLGERRKTYSSRLAQELGKWAEARGKGDAFHNAVFRAYFAEGKNIAKTSVLSGLVKDVEKHPCRQAVQKC